MKCLDTNTLASYAYNLLDGSAAGEVSLHLDACSRCRDIVAQHGRLDAILQEWKAEDPSPGFDARVRLAIEAQQAGRMGWGFGTWQWGHALTMAAFGILLILGAVWFTQGRRRVLVSSPVAARRLQPPKGSQMAPQTASLHPAPSAVHPGVKSVRAVPTAESAVASSIEDKDTQALEDYDLAANFDVLSELPKGEPQRVAN